jgi:hypothetical protein
MAFCFYACGDRTSSILPEAELHHLEDYHCWPYDVSVYTIDEVKLDPAFYRYPLDDYLFESGEDGITHWTNYGPIDTAIWYGMDSTLKGCDDRVDLYDALMRGDPIYFAGTYSNVIVLNGSRKQKYERILFLDLTRKRLHIFKDINKLF